MFQEIRPPSSLTSVAPERCVFLAGSIDMGAAGDWQAELSASLQDIDMTVLNPRRQQWDSSWEQSIDNPQFTEQVEWELQAQEMSSMIAMYFEPLTKAPITLLELGLFARTDKVVVCCPVGFWRKGNVDIVCRRYGVPMVDTLDALTQSVRTFFRIELKRTKCRSAESVRRWLEFPLRPKLHRGSYCLLRYRFRGRR